MRLMRPSGLRQNIRWKNVNKLYVELILSRQSDFSSGTQEEQLMIWDRIFKSWERAGVGGDIIIMVDLHLNFLKWESLREGYNGS